ncbi:SPW repeat domain-containing protein [Antrihabitans cavernicola]|uniref:SPW repeat-containing integral membrane domain-containing protein n=1 Tax=Antrihabitans cavernicola TaxID=2495913 RepID=A0A5A7S2C7_9NOCA|nr:hypothetical protein [Spelaeibacter cavernicola]KAA0015878.1 hypothetical protein FOY51_26945 [Spelaeibacter cavernicola]
MSAFEDRYGTADAWRQKVPGPQLQGVVSGVTLVSGIWLATTPLVWTYGNGVAFDARWNDVPVGLALATLGVLRLTLPIRLVISTALGVGLGVWLTVAPFLLDYGFSVDSTRATLNSLLVAVAGLALCGFIDARRIGTTSTSGAARRRTQKKET